MNADTFDYHTFSVVIFTLYIIIDRVYIRQFIKKNSRELIYKNLKIPLIVNILVIIITGSYLFFYINPTVLIYIKITTAIFLIYGFLNCPFYMKKESCEIRKFMYRFGVVILLMITITLGLYI